MVGLQSIISICLEGLGWFIPQAKEEDDEKAEQEDEKVGLPHTLGFSIQAESRVWGLGQCTYLGSSCF